MKNEKEYELMNEKEHEEEASRHQDELRALFKRYEKNSTVIVNLGDPSDAERFVELVNTAVMVANDFKFDLVGFASELKARNIVLGVFKNMESGMGLMGIRVHVDEDDDDHDDMMISMVPNENETEDDEKTDDDDEKDKIIPRKRRRKRIPVPYYL